VCLPKSQLIFWGGSTCRVGGKVQDFREDKGGKTFFKHLGSVKGGKITREKKLALSRGGGGRV